MGPQISVSFMLQWAGGRWRGLPSSWKESKGLEGRASLPPALSFSLPHSFLPHLSHSLQVVALYDVELHVWFIF